MILSIEFVQQIKKLSAKRRRKKLNHASFIRNKRLSNILLLVTLTDKSNKTLLKGEETLIIGLFPNKTCE